MWRLIVVIGSLLVLAGCNSGPSAPINLPPNVVSGPPPIGNPLFVPAADKDFLFDQTVDVVDDYFRIERQERPRQIGDLVAEGHIETYPETAATIFEPWRGDSVTPYERWESTLQSTRRRASLRIVPGQGGYFVEVAVIKELEDVRHPDKATPGEHIYRGERAQQDRYLDAPALQRTPTYWFALRRDAPLEQEILKEIQERMQTRVPLVPLAVPTVGPAPVPVRPETLPPPPPAILTPVRP